MDSKIVLKAEDLDGYLTEQDQAYLSQMDGLYEKAMQSFKIIAAGGFSSTLHLIRPYNPPQKHERNCDEPFASQPLRTSPTA